MALLISMKMDDSLSPGTSTTLISLRMCVYETCLVGENGFTGCLIFTTIGFDKFCTSIGLPPDDMSKLTKSEVTSFFALELFEYLSGPFPPCSKKHSHLTIWRQKVDLSRLAISERFFRGWSTRLKILHLSEYPVSLSNRKLGT